MLLTLLPPLLLRSALLLHIPKWFADSHHRAIRHDRERLRGLRRWRGRPKRFISPLRSLNNGADLRSRFCRRRVTQQQARP
jgi:hypothetical protein